MRPLAVIGLIAGGAILGAVLYGVGREDEKIAVQACPEVTLGVGEHFFLGAVATNTKHDTLPGKLVYTSRAPDVAAVDSSGRVEGRSAGQAVVAASAVETVSGKPITALVCVTVKPKTEPQKQRA